MHSTTPGTFLQSNKSLAASNKSSFKPTELTANSGYMADDNISQARTPGKVASGLSLKISAILDTSDDLLETIKYGSSK